MAKMTKTLAGYIRQVPIWGAMSFFAGLVTAIIVFISNNQADWSINYIPFKLLGAFLGYMWVSFWNPGGLVTFYLGNHTLTDDEKTLDALSLKYRSRVLMILIPILYVLFDLIIGRTRYQTNASYFDAFFGNIIISFWIVATMTNGVKYISAWWNIKKHWKKEFAS
jgi:hypothetical protein